ncbi:type II secretion system F family protein [Pseudobutyrivibrio ruminis]|uniref:type II secretion system F family protein n=1 Tax=Pseudobutyrivibrio ruminis TaxID=46206 RepID=UPI00048999CA|nr:hypothetical protein [Pseudobutyrivibrio ruminis]
MGKGRRPRKQRKAVSKWSFDWVSVFQGACLSAVIAFLFYKSFLGVFVAAGVIPFWLKLRADEKAKKHRADMLMEFKEYMMLIVASLQTGYSLEKALRQSESELKRLYPSESVLLPFVHVMNQRIGMNVQLEKAFFEFAKEVDLEEAISLAEIISFAKRSGGNYGKNIRDTAFKIEENLSVKQEIETITTEKRLELKVMCVMPLAILAYITITSSSFIAPLYGNALGILIMTACLIAYGLLIMLGRRIIEINI